jgi:hypothetical protein
LMATHLQTNEAKRSFDSFLRILVQHDRGTLIRVDLSLIL